MVCDNSGSLRFIRQTRNWKRSRRSACISQRPLKTTSAYSKIGPMLDLAKPSKVTEKKDLGYYFSNTEHAASAWKSIIDVLIPLWIRWHNNIQVPLMACHMKELLVQADYRCSHPSSGGDLSCCFLHVNRESPVFQALSKVTEAVKCMRENVQPNRVQFHLQTDCSRREEEHAMADQLYL